MKKILLGLTLSIVILIEQYPAFGLDITDDEFFQSRKHICQTTVREICSGLNAWKKSGGSLEEIFLKQAQEFDSKKYEEMKLLNSGFVGVINSFFDSLIEVYEKYPDIEHEQMLKFLGIKDEYDFMSANFKHPLDSEDLAPKRKKTKT